MPFTEAPPPSRAGSSSRRHNVARTRSTSRADRATRGLWWCSMSFRLNVPAITSSYRGVDGRAAQQVSRKAQTVHPGKVQVEVAVSAKQVGHRHAGGTVGSTGVLEQLMPLLARPSPEGLVELNHRLGQAVDDGGVLPRPSRADRVEHVADWRQERLQPEPLVG